MKRPEQVETFALAGTNRVVRYKIDQVGNDLTAHLAWCSTHQEPLWVFSDGSHQCPYDLVTECTHDHEITDGPWESDPADQTGDER